MLKELIPQRVLATDGARKALGSFFDQGGTTWFLDIESPNRITLNGTEDAVFSLQTHYQRLEVFRTARYGLCLVLDGRMQLAESDEWIYHELLVHPACVIHGAPRRAIVLGGGDGCAVRELLKYPMLGDITLVDIDEQVVAAFRDRFCDINHGALRNRRVKVFHDDASSYLETQKQPFDIIIADLTEPFDPSELAGDLSENLYTSAFYDLIQKKLAPDGIFVCQSGGVLYQPEHDGFHNRIVRDIKVRFPHVNVCYEFVPSFVELWSVTLAARRPLHLKDYEVEQTLQKLDVRGLRYYDGVSHERAFRLPKSLRTVAAPAVQRK
jgi:spermidine synthase